MAQVVQLLASQKHVLFVPIEPPEAQETMQKVIDFLAHTMYPTEQRYSECYLLLTAEALPPPESLIQTTLPPVRFVVELVEVQEFEHLIDFLLAVLELLFQELTLLAYHRKPLSEFQDDPVPLVYFPKQAVDAVALA